MFQFRRFPAYAYLIQRRLLQYCCSGFPHSEISGSKPICGSPKLIAACHVLLRLLMPRHSPCALYSLTCRQGKEFRSVSTAGLRPLVKTPLHFLPSPPPLKNSFLSGSPFGRQKIALLFFTSLLEEVQFSLVLKNYAGSCQVHFGLIVFYPLSLNVTLLLPSHNLHHRSVFSFQGAFYLQLRIFYPCLPRRRRGRQY